MAKAAPETPNLDEYEDRFLACRDLRHAWQTFGYYRHNGATRRKLTCLRCKTSRTDDWSGFEVKRHYEYTDGYRVEGRVYAVDVRDEILKRVTVYKDEDAMLAALKGGSTRGKRRPAARNTTKVVDLRETSTERRQVARKRAGRGATASARR